MGAAEVIRRAREAAGLSKRELARRAGTSPAAIVAYEAGDREPTFRTLRRLVRAAGYDTVEKVLEAPPEQLLALPGFDGETVDAVFAAARSERERQQQALADAAAQAEASPVAAEASGEPAADEDRQDT